MNRILLPLFVVLFAFVFYSCQSNDVGMPADLTAKGENVKKEQQEVKKEKSKEQVEPVVAEEKVETKGKVEAAKATTVKAESKLKEAIDVEAKAKSDVAAAKAVADAKAADAKAAKATADAKAAAEVKAAADAKSAADAKAVADAKAKSEADAIAAAEAAEARAAAEEKAAEERAAAEKMTAMQAAEIVAVEAVATAELEVTEAKLAEKAIVADAYANKSKNITFNSTPISAVYVNGTLVGETPADTTLFYGNYSVEMKMKRKIYTANLLVYDSSSNVFEYTFPRPDYFISYGVSMPAANEFLLSSYTDITFGMVFNRVGWFVRAKTSYSFKEPQYNHKVVSPDGFVNSINDIDVNGLTDETSFAFNGKHKMQRMGVAAGIVVKTCKPLYVAAGVGYGYANVLAGVTRTLDRNKTETWSRSLTNSFQGVEADLSLIFKFGKRFGFNAGVTTVDFKYCEMGVGFNIWW